MYERMLDKQIKPTIEEFFNYTKSCKDILKKLDDYLCGYLGLNKEMRFPYGNSYGWSFKYTFKKKLICEIFSENNAFTVMIRLTDKQFNSLTDITDYTKEYIDNKYPCGDGGFIHYRVTDITNYKDIVQIINKKFSL